MVTKKEIENISIDESILKSLENISQEIISNDYDYNNLNYDDINERLNKIN